MIVAVLERARLAFVGIAHQILGPAYCLGMKLHLSPAENRRRAAAQSDFLTSAMTASGVIFSLNSLQRAIAAARLIILETPVRAVEAFIRIASGRSRASLQLRKQLIQFLVRHGAAHAPVVDQQHRRVAAGAHAFAFFSVKRPSAVSVEPTPRRCLRCWRIDAARERMADWCKPSPCACPRRESYML